MRRVLVAAADASSVVVVVAMVALVLLNPGVLGDNVYCTPLVQAFPGVEPPRLCPEGGAERTWVCTRAVIVFSVFALVLEALVHASRSVVFEACLRSEEAAAHAALGSVMYNCTSNLYILVAALTVALLQLGVAVLTLTTPMKQSARS